MKPVNSHTRAGAKGKKIVCPHCSTILTVYHFNWCGLRCLHCFIDIEKKDWFIANT